MSQKKQKRAGKSGKNNGAKKNALWYRKREGERPLVVALVACLCVLGILAGYFLQNSSLQTMGRTQASAQTGTIRLSEVMSENASTILSSTGDAPDWIEIENTGSSSVNLSKYSLALESNINRIFVFPDCTIAPGEYLVIYA